MLDRRTTRAARDPDPDELVLAGDRGDLALPVGREVDPGAPAVLAGGAGVERGNARVVGDLYVRRRVFVVEFMERQFGNLGYRLLVRSAQFARQYPRG